MATARNDDISPETNFEGDSSGIAILEKFVATEINLDQRPQTKTAWGPK